jgi:hypothetical protein
MASSREPQVAGFVDDGLTSLLRVLLRQTRLLRSRRIPLKPKLTAVDCEKSGARRPEGTTDHHQRVQKGTATLRDAFPRALAARASAVITVQHRSARCRYRPGFVGSRDAAIKTAADPQPCEQKDVDWSPTAGLNVACRLSCSRPYLRHRHERRFLVRWSLASHA